MKACLWFCTSFALLASISPSEAMYDPTLSPEGALCARFQALIPLFQKAVEAAQRAPYEAFDYAHTLGQLDQSADFFPPTPYSRFLHWARVIEGFHLYAKVDLPQEALTQMTAVLEGTESVPSLRSVLGRLADLAPHASEQSSEMLFLLGLSSTVPEEAPVKVSLPEVMAYLSASFFDLWKDYVTWKEPPSKPVGQETQNGEADYKKDETAGASNLNPSTEEAVLKAPLGLFADLLEFKVSAEEGGLTDAVQAALGAPLGTLEDQTPTTLFGKAILVQKILACVLKGAPAHYPRLHHLLTHPQCSVQAALAETKVLLHSPGAIPPRHTVANRLDKIHGFWKTDLLERLSHQKDYWPVSCQVPSLQDRLTTLYNQIADLLPFFSSLQDRERALALMEALSPISGACPLTHFSGALIMLERLIRIPSQVVDGLTMQVWCKVIGNANDTTSRTLFGILNEVGKIITEFHEAPDPQAWKHIETLMGTPQDAPFAPDEAYRKATYWGLVNGLAFSTLEAALDWEAIENSLESLPEILRLPLKKRFETLQEAIRQIFRSKRFWGVDRLIEALQIETPKLLEALSDEVLKTNSEALAEAAEAAWWSQDSPLFGPLNRMIGAAVGASSICLLGGAVDPALSNSTQLTGRFQDLSWTLERVQANLKEGLEKATAASEKPEGRSLQTMAEGQDEAVTVEDPLSFEEAPLRFKALTSLVGSPHFSQLGPKTTLSSCLAWAQKILPAVAPLLTPQAALEVWQLLTAPQGLYALLHRLHTLTESLKISPSSTLFEEAQTLLTARHGLYDPSTLLGQVNLLLRLLLTPFFEVMVDASQAHLHGLNFESSPWRAELQELRVALEASKMKWRKEALTFGEPWQNHHALTVFGRWKAYEEAVLEKGLKGYILPTKALLELTARFGSRIRRGMREIVQSESTVSNDVRWIGMVDDAPEAETLWGLLKAMLEKVLVGSSEESLDEASVLVTELEKVLAKADSQDSPQVNENENPLNLQAALLGFSKTLRSVASFLPLHGAEQLEAGIQEFSKEVQKSHQRLSSSTSEELAQLALRVGQPSDLEGRVPSLFAQINRLTLHLHALVFPLRKAYSSVISAEAWAFLESRKSALCPGDCQASAVTAGLRVIQTSLHGIEALLEMILVQKPQNRALPQAKAEVFNQKQAQLLGMLRQAVQGGGRALTRAAQNLQDVFQNSQNGVGLADVMADLAQESQATYSALQALFEHWGYEGVLQTEQSLLPLATWSCKALGEAFKGVNQTLKTLTEALERVSLESQHFEAYVADKAILSEAVGLLALDIKAALPSAYTIQSFLRRQVTVAQSWPCPDCDGKALAKEAEVCSLRLGLLAEAIAALSSTLETQAETSLLKLPLEALTLAKIDDQGVSLAEIMAPFSERLEAMEAKLRVAMYQVGLHYSEQGGASKQSKSRAGD